MAEFVALYAGETVSNARLIALSANAGIVAQVAEQMLESDNGQESNPALDQLARGRRAALRLLAGKTKGEVSR